MERKDQTCLRARVGGDDHFYPKRVTPTQESIGCQWSVFSPRFWPAKVLAPAGCSGLGGGGWASSVSGFFHAVAVAFGDYDVGVVEEPVEHGAGGCVLG